VNNWWAWSLCYIAAHQYLAPWWLCGLGGWPYWVLWTNTIDWVPLITQKAVTFMQTLPYISWCTSAKKTQNDHALSGWQCVTSSLSNILRLITGWPSYDQHHCTDHTFASLMDTDQILVSGSVSLIHAAQWVTIPLTDWWMLARFWSAWVCAAWQVITDCKANEYWLDFGQHGPTLLSMWQWIFQTDEHGPDYV